MTGTHRNGTVYKWVAGISVPVAVLLIGATLGNRAASGDANAVGNELKAHSDEFTEHKLSLQSHPTITLGQNALKDDILEIKDAMKSGFAEMRESQRRMWQTLSEIRDEVRKP